MASIVLIHGMGRTPLSMQILRLRLVKQGYRVLLFGYSQSFESLETVSRRLTSLIRRRIGAEPYVLAGHSLGTVIIRNTMSALDDNPPAACFFFAPPIRACKVARHFAGWRFYRLLTGEMGQLLANADFMDKLPMPRMPTRIYAGTAGPRANGWYAPFGDELNDGILTLTEASSETAPVLQIASMHTFIMNSREVSRDMLNTLAALGLNNPARPEA